MAVFVCRRYLHMAPLRVCCTYDVIGFVQPLTVVGVIARVSAAVPFDLMHSAATCVFLAALYAPWTRRIDRVVQKYGLRAGE